MSTCKATSERAGMELSFTLNELPCCSKIWSDNYSQAERAMKNATGEQRNEYNRILGILSYQT